MMVASLIAWWYSTGWLQLILKVGQAMRHTSEFFSVNLLLGSMFAPFRQIGVGSVQGPLKAQLSAWLDKQFSRFMGFIVRSILLLVWILAVVGLALGGAIAILAWPIAPFLPVVVLIVAPKGGL